MQIDFLKSYGDETHHGKEEDILFREVERKNISEQHRNDLAELLEEHVQAREKIKHLNKLNESFIKGDKRFQAHLVASLEDLNKFYLQHIEKENTRFFINIKKYFNDEERNLMMKEYAEFDRNIIHEKYKKLIAELEKKINH